MSFCKTATYNARWGGGRVGSRHNMRVGKLDEGWVGWYDGCDYRRILSQHTWHTLYRYIVPALFTRLIASSSQFNGHRRRRRGCCYTTTRGQEQPSAALIHDFATKLDLTAKNVASFWVSDRIRVTVSAGIELPWPVNGFVRAPPPQTPLRPPVLSPAVVLPAQELYRIKCP